MFRILLRNGLRHRIDRPEFSFWCRLAFILGCIFVHKGITGDVLRFHPEDSLPALVTGSSFTPALFWIDSFLQTTRSSRLDYCFKK